MIPNSHALCAARELELINKAIHYLRRRFLDTYCLAPVDSHVPQPYLMGLICGSGFDAFTDILEHKTEIYAFADVPHLLTPNVSGHAGGLVSGTIAGFPILVACGRSHQYEGDHPWDTVRLTRVMGRLCETVMTTAYVGSPKYAPHTAVLVDDVNTLFLDSPLIGPNIEALMEPVDKRECPRFPDMHEPFSLKLQELICQALGDAKVDMVTHIDEGNGYYRTYGGGYGPHYETRADVRALERLGIDLFGMSMVLEAITFKHMGVPLVGLAGVGNWATSRDPNWKPGDKVDHEIGMKIIRQIVERLKPLLPAYVRLLAAELNWK